MDVHKDEHLELAWLVNKLHAADWILSVVAKASFQFRDDGSLQMAAETALPSGDVHVADDANKSLVYPSDFVPFKPYADILILGTGRAPAGRPAVSFPVAICVKDLRKSLQVNGPRKWQKRFLRAIPGPAQPIASLPITYENAFGGKGFARNPVGLGRDTVEVHNIESFRQDDPGSSSVREPAGFAPLASEWDQRKRKAGTYKGKWVKDRWPWFPENFDWSYFNAAPADQQIEGYLRGDEQLEFENLHPTHPIYKSRLPGLRVRCFLNERLQNGELLFREVRMNLDTLWINMDEGKLILVWRGLAPVRTLKLREMEHVFAVMEPLSELPRNLEDYRVEFMQGLNEGGEVELSEAAAAAAAFEKRFVDMDKEFAAAEQEMTKMEVETTKAFEEQRVQLIAQGVDPRLFEEPTKPQTLVEAKAEHMAAIDQLKRTDPEHAARIGEIDFAEFEQMEAEMAQMEAEMAAANPPPPTRESVQASIAGDKGGASRNLSNQDLSALDLSGMDFSGVDLSGAGLSRANLTKTNFAGANLTGADLSGADLTEADFTGATLNEADLSKAMLVKTKLTGMAVTGATFSELDLSGADFSACHGKGADFSKANLAGARFIAAKLPQSDFSGATLEKADFNSAELPAAQFDGVKAKGVQMEKADISGLHGGDKADFTSGNFRGAKGAGSIWEQSMLDGADFSKALLTRANFNEASLREARFDRADALKASFDDAWLQGAVLTNANLLRATFDRADLTQANFSNSNLYGAGFWETVSQHTIIDGANVKETQIAK
jgi:uncharacterized protein YjbI with pentapeptide repeats